MAGTLGTSGGKASTLARHSDGDDNLLQLKLVWVGNLTRKMCRKRLKQALAEYGEVVAVRFVERQDTRLSGR